LQRAEALALALIIEGLRERKREREKVCAGILEKEGKH